MLSEQSDAPSPPSDDQSLEDRIEATLLECHVVDPKRLEEIDQMRTEVRRLVESNDHDEATRLAKLCIDYIRQGQATME